MNTENTTILSIDGATKTGYAIYKDGRITEHGTKRFRKETRCCEYGCWLEKIIKEKGVTHIVAENIYREHTQTKDAAFQVLANLQGVLVYISGCYNVPVTFYDPLFVKSKIIPTVWGKQHTRTEDKERMIGCVTNRYGYSLADSKADDEADAIGIMITYLLANNLPVTHPKDK